MKTIECPHCKMKTIIQEEGVGLIYTCPKCGYTMACTNEQSTVWSQSDVRISIEPLAAPTKAQILLVSKLTSGNSYNAASIIKTGGFLLSCSKEDAGSIISQLSQAGFEIVNS